MVKVCWLCESSCEERHSYKVNNIDCYVCDRCYGIIKGIVEEVAPKPKPPKKTKKTKYQKK